MINELDLRELWLELDKYEKELKEESKVLEEVWIKIAQLKQKNEADAKKIMDRPEFRFREPDDHIGVNVGGQIFETTVSVLTRDPYSVLASCCTVDSLIKPDPETQLFYFDRDWWVFRHVLAYLRSNVLPNEIETLKELYTEASFYRIESLQRAIETIPLHQISNFSPQIAMSVGGHQESHVLNQSLFHNLGRSSYSSSVNKEEKKS